MPSKRDRRIDKVEKWLLESDDKALRKDAAKAEKELDELIADGRWKVAGVRLSIQAMRLGRLGMRDVLQGRPEGWLDIERRLYRGIYRCIANPFGLSGNEIGTKLAYLIFVDDRNRLRQFTDLAEEGGIRGLCDSTHAGNFMAILAARALGRKAPKKRDLGVYEGLLDAWKKPKAFAAAVEQACEKHLQGMGLTEDIGEFEDLQLVPIEIAAVRALREKEELEFPEVDHPLLQTPLADIPQRPTYQPAEDAPLQRYLAAARAEQPDLAL
jgi:hypothetical protein